MENQVSHLMTWQKDGELVLRQQRRLCCVQHKEVCVLPIIHFCPRGIGQMIGCSDTRDYQLTFSLIQCWSGFDRIPSTTPGAEPPRDARDSGSARSHSTHLETSSSDRPKWSPTRRSTRY